MNVNFTIIHFGVIQTSLWSPSDQYICQCLSLNVDGCLKFNNTITMMRIDCNMKTGNLCRGQTAGFHEVSESDVGEPFVAQRTPLTSEELEELDWLTMEKQETSR